MKDAAYAFFSYVDVTIGKYGFNPYRIWQLSHNTSGKTGGMSEKLAA